MVELLRHHYGDGRLTEDELSERVETAYRVKTMSELEALTADLPHRRASGKGDALATSVRIHLRVYILVNLMLIGIWAATGAGYFWPIWPILGWGIGVGSHAAPLHGVRRRKRRAPVTVERPRALARDALAPR